MSVSADLKKICVYQNKTVIAYEGPNIYFEKKYDKDIKSVSLSDISKMVIVVD